MYIQIASLDVAARAPLALTSSITEYAMENVFSSRKYQLASGQEVTLEVGNPSKDGALWRCTARVLWPEKDDFVLKSAGVDKLDAMMATLRLVAILLESRTEWKDGSLTWLQGPDLGLSLVTVGTSDAQR